MKHLRVLIEIHFSIDPHPLPHKTTNNNNPQQNTQSIQTQPQLKQNPQLLFQLNSVALYKLNSKPNSNPYSFPSIIVTVSSSPLHSLRARHTTWLHESYSNTTITKITRATNSTDSCRHLQLHDMTNQ